METHKWMRTKIDNSVVVVGKKLVGIFELSGVRLTSYRAVVVGDMGEAEGPGASIISTAIDDVLLHYRGQIRG